MGEKKEDMLYCFIYKPLNFKSMNETPGGVKKSEPEFDIILKSFNAALDRYSNLAMRSEETVAKLREFRTPEDCSNKPVEPLGVVEFLHAMVNRFESINNRLEKTLIGLQNCV